VAGRAAAAALPAGGDSRVVLFCELPLVAGLVIPPPEKENPILARLVAVGRRLGWLVGPCPWLIWSDIRGSLLEAPPLLRIGSRISGLLLQGSRLGGGGGGVADPSCCLRPAEREL